MMNRIFAGMLAAVFTFSQISNNGCLSYQKDEKVFEKENYLQEEVRMYEYSKEEERIAEQAIKQSCFDGKKTAKIINSIDNSQAFEKCVINVLDGYYEDDNNVSAELSGFSKTIDERADLLLQDYEAALSERKNTALNYVPGEILVEFDSSISKDEIENLIGTVSDGGTIISNTYEIDEHLSKEKIEKIEKAREEILETVVLVRINKNQTTAQAIEMYQKMSCVVSASVNGEMELSDIEINDEYGDYLWHLNRVNVNDAWAAVQSSNTARDVRVAVIDTGIDMTQPDLVHNIIRSQSADITGSSPVLLRSLSKGYVDKHGTEVAGIIAAQVNNNIGVAGIGGISSSKNDFRCRIIAIQAFTLDSDGKYKITMENAIKAVNYAVAQGAEVINISSGTYIYNSGFENAINYAYKSGVTVVAAAGNDSTNKAVYPSDFNHVISVIATEPENEKAYFSNYGSKKDISAPGFSIYTTRPDNTYEACFGTSHAAPIVAGIAAMMKSVNGDLTPDQIEQIIKETATDIYVTGRDDMTAYGLINGGLAVQHAKWKTYSDTQPVIVGINSVGKGSVTFNFNTIANEERYTVYRSTSKNGPFESVKSIKIDGTGKYIFTDTDLVSGQTYYYKIRAKSTYGSINKYSPYSEIASCKVS